MKRFPSTVVMLVVSATIMGAYSHESLSEEAVEREGLAAEGKDAEFKDLDERFSYAYGADLAAKFKAEGIELNPDILAAAIKDVYGGGETRMPDGEIAATLGLYFELHTKRQEEARAAAGEVNKKEGARFLAENAKKEGVVVTESGLQYRVINKGSGEQKPQADDVVTVHYRGSLVDGTEFDSTYKRNEPFSGKTKRLIPGWTEAIQLMSKGAKWELVIPADLAYGERGSEPFIGPNAVLIFEVELLDIDKAS